MNPTQKEFSGSKQTAQILRPETEGLLLDSEERLRLATEVAFMGSWERDLRSDRLYWSPSLEKLNGFPPATFPGTFAALRDLVHPDDLAVMDDARRRAIEGDGEYQVELRFKRREGGYRWGLERGKVLAGPDGKPERIVGIELDITDRKEAELAGTKRLELRPNCRDLRERCRVRSIRFACGLMVDPTFPTPVQNSARCLVWIPTSLNRTLPRPLR